RRRFEFAQNDFDTAFVQHFPYLPVGRHAGAESARDGFVGRCGVVGAEWAFYLDVTDLAANCGGPLFAVGSSVAQDAGQRREFSRICGTAMLLNPDWRGKEYTAQLCQFARLQ